MSVSFAHPWVSSKLQSLTSVLPPTEIEKLLNLTSLSPRFEERLPVNGVEKARVKPRAHAGSRVGTRITSHSPSSRHTFLLRG